MTRASSRIATWSIGAIGITLAGCATRAKSEERDAPAFRAVRSAPQGSTAKTGELRIRHENGNDAVRGQLVGAKPNGTFESWFEDGARSAVAEFTSGRATGRWTRWYRNGQRRVTGSFVKGKKHGTFTWWHENGKRRMQGEYLSNRRHGLWVVWDEKGREVTREVYSAGSSGR